MSSVISFKEAERRAFRFTFQDGLWDIYLGLLLLAMAIYALLSEIEVPDSRVMTIFIGLEVLAILFLVLGKRFITAPRIGMVKFGPDRKAQLNKARLVLAISVFIGMLLLIMDLATRVNLYEGLNRKFLNGVLWSVNMIAIFSLGAYFLNFNRLYAYGVLYALAVPIDAMLNKFLDIDISFIAFGIPAAIILLIGLIVFTRFLRDYPVPTGDLHWRKETPDDKR